MSRKIQNSVLLVVIFVFLSSCWMLYTENRKSDENLPSLDQLLLMESDKADRRVTGYMEHQLLETWGKPDRSDAETLIWKTQDGAVIAFTDTQGKIIRCQMTRIIDLPILYDVAFMEDQEMVSRLLGRFADQITPVWDRPDETGLQLFSWHLPPHSPHRALTVEVDRWGRVCDAKFRD